MESTRDVITDGAGLVQPTEKSLVVDALTVSEKKIYQNESGAETTNAESLEKQSQMPQVPQMPQAENLNGTPQLWTGILSQTASNGVKAGMNAKAQTVWRKGVPMLTIAIYPAFICSECKQWNYGLACNNTDCTNFGVEIKEPIPQ